MSLLPHPRFASADVHSLGDDATLVVTPTGSTFRIEADAHTVDAILRSFDGTTPSEQVLAAIGAPAGFEEVVDVLRAEGCLVDTLVDSRPVVLLGDEILVRQLRSLLDGQAADLSITAAADVDDLGPDLDPNTVLVVCRDRFERARLLSVDAFAAERKLRWTQLHFTVQGAVWGPHIEPGRTARYSDVLQRRKCAIDQPDIFDATSVSWPCVHPGPGPRPSRPHTRRS